MFYVVLCLMFIVSMVCRVYFCIGTIMVPTFYGSYVITICNIILKILEPELLDSRLSWLCLKKLLPVEQKENSIHY